MKLITTGALGLVALGVAVLVRPRPMSPQLAGGRKAPLALNDPAAPDRSNGPRRGTAIMTEYSPPESHDTSHVSGGAHPPEPAAQFEPLEADSDAEETFVSWLVRVPEGTPEDETIYLCGSSPTVGCWDPQGIALQLIETRLYRIDLALRVGTRLEYKFTRGSWYTVEKRRDGTDRPNRVLAVGSPEEILANIEAWADQV